MREKPWFVLFISIVAIVSLLKPAQAASASALATTTVVAPVQLQRVERTSEALSIVIAPAPTASHAKDRNLIRASVRVAGLQTMNFSASTETTTLAAAGPGRATLLLYEFKVLPSHIFDPASSGTDISAEALPQPGQAPGRYEASVAVIINFD